VHRYPCTDDILEGDSTVPRTRNNQIVQLMLNLSEHPHRFLWSKALIGVAKLGAVIFCDLAKWTRFQAQPGADVTPYAQVEHV